MSEPYAGVATQAPDGILDPPNAVIDLVPGAYTTSSSRLMGAQVAGQSFLEGFMAHGKARDLWVQTRDQASLQSLREGVARLDNTRTVRSVNWDAAAAIAEVGVVYHPGPGLSDLAWKRTISSGTLGHRAWSICGITHTLCSNGAMDALTGLLTAPIQAWDALICTSQAAKVSVACVLQAHAEYLAERLGAKTFTRPQLPVIPLGIDTKAFGYSDADKAAARSAIGADEHTHVVLFVGRLSFHAKAHPLAMYQALERSGELLPPEQRVVLVEFGQHANDYARDAFAEAARAACPRVRVVTLDGRSAEARDVAWACADVFCSLSDNIQETFGIAPIEAMAAGLPVVVSDWDGYKDTVRDGIDGFRIPTIMPVPGLATDLARRHALDIDTYDRYIGYTCSLVAVDVEAAAAAFAALFASRQLRRQMGESGRQRARAIYDWAHVIPRYEALWAQLNHIRLSQSPSQLAVTASWPARLDPFHVFAGYPTRALMPESMLALVDADVSTVRRRLAKYRELAMVRYADALLPTQDELQVVLDAVASGPRSAAEMVAGIASERQAAVFRALTWLIKLNALRLL